MEKAKSSTATHEEPKKGEVAEEIREVVTALHGDLTKLAGGKADKTISHWQTTLESLGGASLKSIAHDLGTLKTLVSAQSPDGAKIGKSLEGLGTKVGKVAEEQGGVIGAALKSLSGALHKGSTSLVEDKS